MRRAAWERGYRTVAAARIESAAWHTLAWAVFGAGFVAAVAFAARVIRASPGDVLLGLASAGVHSNGFSLVRRVAAAAGLTLADPAPLAPGETLGAALLALYGAYVWVLL